MEVDWTEAEPRVSRIVCEDEVTSLVVTEKYLVCQHWIQPEISVFSRSSYELERKLVGHEYGGQCLETNQAGILFSASLDRCLISWDLDSGNLIDKVSDHADYVQCIGYNAPWVATGGQGDKKIFVYMVDSIGKLRQKYKLRGHTGWVKRISILGNTLVSGGLDSTVRIWDLWTGHQTRSLPVVSPVMSLSLISLNLALFGGKEGDVSFLDLTTGHCTTAVPSVKFCQDRYRRVLKFHQGSVDALLFLDEEKLVITGGEDRHVTLWRIKKSEQEDLRFSEINEIETIREHCEYINTVFVYKNCIFSCSGDVNVLVHEYPIKQREGQGATAASLDLQANQDVLKPPVDEAKQQADFESFMALMAETKKNATKDLAICLDLEEKSAREDRLKLQYGECFEECYETGGLFDLEDKIWWCDRKLDTILEEVENSESSRSESAESSSSLSRSGRLRRKRRRWLIQKNQVEIHEELGRGKFGIAFRGTYRNMKVAVKVTYPMHEKDFAAMEESIIKEVGRFCRCRHPSLVKYFGLVANKEDLNFWIVTEFLEGHTLSKLIQEPEVKSLYSLRRRERLQLSEYLASALEYLHSNNIIHGRLTASNIFISKSEENRKDVKISDYGLFSMLKGGKESNQKTDPYKNSINELFIPPEILLNQQAWDDRSDIWCLGAILLEFNLESYMWDRHCIEKAKINYVDGVDRQEPIRFGLRIRWSSFEFLWDCLNYKTDLRPKASDLADGFQLLICQNTKTIRELPLTDDMIFWLSKQHSLLANWQSLAAKLGVNSVVPIVKDVVNNFGDRVSVVLEAWKVKFAEEANLALLISTIQSLQLQSVVDGFYREFQISKTRPKSEIKVTTL